MNIDFDEEKGSSLVGTVFIFQVDDLLRAGSTVAGFRDSTETPPSPAKSIRQ